MSLIQWEPFGQFDRFFEEFRSVPFLKMSTDLAVDVYEKDGKIIAEMNVPGVDPEKIDVVVDGNHLRVTGSHSEESEKKDRHYYSKEIRRGSFERLVTLPSLVKRNEVDAEYRNGVLRVIMQKAESSHEQKIKVNVKA